MAEPNTFTCILADDQMRLQLQNGVTLVFKLDKDWRALERQVERLGFGEQYLVSHTQGRHGDLTKVSPAH
jgi:hypothetical protein